LLLFSVAAQASVAVVRPIITMLRVAISVPGIVMYYITSMLHAAITHLHVSTPLVLMLILFHNSTI
jgi:hypothetical protein